MKTKRDEGFYFKVGFSKSPKKRLSAIQTGCPTRVHLVYRALGSKTLESKIHNSLKRYKVSGEWFNCTESEAIRAIINVCGEGAYTTERIKRKKKKPKLY